MAFHRVYAIILKNLFLFRRQMDKIVDTFYWPTIDLFLWGLTAVYFEKNGQTGVSYLLLLVSGIVFWLLVWRAQYEIGLGLLDELWNRNLLNIFGTPLKFREWLLALLFIGFFKALLSFLFASLMAYILYSANIYRIAWNIVPLFGLLLMTGWAIGCFIAGIIMRLGTKFQALAWSFVAIISPFSAIYYPADVLPDWAQNIARWIPTTYVFESMRKAVSGDGLDFSMLATSFVLNLLYLSLALIFIHRSFRHVLRRGLISLH